MGYLKKLAKKITAPVTEVPAILESSYYPSLDGLRGVAILMVILYHFGINYYLEPFGLILNGQIGVDIFFVISGFLITALLLKEKITYGQISLKRFYARRALRIIPAAYLFLAVVILIKLTGHFKILVVKFLAAFLFYKNVPYTGDRLTGHFWSLAAEVQFYLIFPFLLTLNIGRYTLLVTFIVIALPIVSLFGYYHAGFVLNHSLMALAVKLIMYSFWKGPYIILIGSLAAVLVFKGIITVPVKSNNFLSLQLLLIAITISTRTFIFYGKYVCEFLSAVLIAWSIILNIADRNFLSKLLTKPVFIKTGIISYSLYLWQQLFTGVRTWQPWMKPFHGLPLVLLILVKLGIVYAIAWLSWRFIELKFMKIKTGYEPKA